MLNLGSFEKEQSVGLDIQFGITPISRRISGLGLSLAYDIVTKGHGGKIEIFSQEGDGTEFTIRLPIAM